MARLYPLFADLTRRPVLVVGGGVVGQRKAEALLAAGARVTVGAPLITGALASRVRKGDMRHRRGRFEASWLDGAWLVIAATDDRDLNRRVAEAATARGTWVNVVDDPELSSFQVPAVVHRPPLTVAISSAGTAPALARHVRERIELILDEGLGALARLLARYRDAIRHRIADVPSRRRFYDRLITGEVGRLVRHRGEAAAEEALKRALRQPTTVTGRVALVGAGPGDPALLTLAGLRRLQEADVILHDRLVQEDVLSLARRDAERIDVGKQAGRPRITQAAINRLMVRLARQGKQVVRLKGGDPLIFGRGGEELEYLRAHEVAFEVVPGITAAGGCAAYAGVPLTHRQHASSVVLVTAHSRAALDALDWRALARQNQTLAVYMGVGQLAYLPGRLIRHGRGAATPFALIERGTTKDQRVITGTLASLPAMAEAHDIVSPALLIIGETAALANSLAWFGTPVRDEREARSSHAA